VLDEKARGAVVDELRLAFASGRPALGEELLARALSDGLPWDVVTRAVAEGVAHHYGTRLPPEKQVPDAVASP
jgi:hypothetical protein